MRPNQPSKQPYKPVLLRLWLMLSLLLGATSSGAQNNEGLMPVPPLSGHVVDLSATLSSEQQRALEQRLTEFEARKGSQIAVLLIPGTQPEAIEQYAIRVAEQWKLGRKKIDDGAILVIAKNEHALRIEVGYGLEGALNDATAKRIIDDIIVPYFKNADYYGGINSGVDAMLQVIDGEALPAPDNRGSGLNADGAKGMLPLLFFAAVIVGGIFRSLFGRFAGAVVTGGVLGLAAWLLLGLAAAALAALLGFVLTLVGGRMGSGWQGGGGRSGWGGGGFQGGGGGFGGGGASGRW
jgi:uncharacterized protein